MKSSELVLQPGVRGPAAASSPMALDIAVSRRQLLALAGVTVAGMVAAGSLAPPSFHANSSGAASEPPVSPSLSVETFFPLIGEAFAFEASDGASGSLTLSDITALEPLGDRPAELRLQPFSLLFTLVSGALGKGGIVALEHAALGRFDIFVQRVLAGEPVRYEAIFN